MTNAKEITTTNGTMLFGGDYNPEQWPESVWQEDVKLFSQARINTVTLNVFSWARLQPDESTYDFARLDRIMALAEANGLSVVLGTATAALPAWMSRQFPDVNRVDIEGRQRRHGDRHNACPNSPSYRRFASELVSRLVSRYSNSSALVAWHISNEYGGYCYCDNCAAAFRLYLEDKYQTVANLNSAWISDFWGHTYQSFADIFPPNRLGDAIDPQDLGRSFMPQLTMNYRQFQSDSLRGIYRLEKELLRQVDKHTPITTNFMGAYPLIDYFSWADDVDEVSWDCYPAHDTTSSETAFAHSLMRGIKGGQPFLLMEQTPSRANWMPYNLLKRPGQMRQQSYQAVSLGADSVQFFQMRRSRAGCEKFHGSVIDHDGTGNTRTFREVTQLGEELSGIGNRLLGARTEARVAIVFDWPSWWGFAGSVGPSKDFDYPSAVRAYFAAFYQQGIAVDVISIDADLASYDLVVAPYLYVLSEAAAVRLQEFVAAGGQLLSTVMSALTNHDDVMHLGGTPGPLREVLGVWAEETDSLPQDRTVGCLWGQEESGHFSTYFDVLQLEGAATLASYGPGEYYSGSPAVTANRYGKGTAYYVAAVPEQAALEAIVGQIVVATPSLAGFPTPVGVELNVRVGETGSYAFYLNSLPEAVTTPVREGGFELLSQVAVAEDITLPPYGVAIVAEGASQ